MSPPDQAGGALARVPALPGCPASAEPARSESTAEATKAAVFVMTAPLIEAAVAAVPKLLEKNSASGFRDLQPRRPVGRWCAAGARRSALGYPAPTNPVPCYFRGR